MATTITEVLNQLNQMGVFSYALPFMLVFAIVFGLLQKTKIFGDEQKAKGVNVIISLAIAGISLLFDVVPRFFSTIFPKFGVGLAVFIVVMIFLAFFYSDENGNPKSGIKWVGIVLTAGVLIWALAEWNDIGGFGFSYWKVGGWLGEYLPLIIVLILIVVGISAVIGGGISGGKSSKG